MLQRCAEALVEHLDGAFARIWTLNEQEDVLELRASAGLYTHLDGPHSRVPVGKYKIGLIAQERKPHLTNAVVGDPRVGDQEWARREGMVAFAGYPLVVDDRLVGVMAMFARHPLTEATLEAMASVADEIAVGIERKVAEERLHEQREWLPVTLASIGDAVIATDDQGRVTFLNGVAQETDRAGRWTMRRGNRWRRCSPSSTSRPGSRSRTRWRRCCGKGSSSGWRTTRSWSPGTGRSGPIDDSAAPIRDAAGSCIGVVLIFRDVTEQRRAEQELRASEARKSAILETALDCIITMDHEGKVVEFNPAAERTFGYRREQVIGQELGEFIIPPSLRERHRTAWPTTSPRAKARSSASGWNFPPCERTGRSSRSNWPSPASRRTARRCSRPTCGTSPKFPARWRSPHPAEGPPLFTALPGGTSGGRSGPSSTATPGSP